MRPPPSWRIATTRNADRCTALVPGEPVQEPGVAVGAGIHPSGCQTPGRPAADSEGDHRAGWVAVIGPPAVGKTTTTGWATAVQDASALLRGNPNNTERDNCVGWQRFAVSALPEPLSGYASLALVGHLNGQHDSEPGWD
jgi:hypothetical protein